MASINKVSSTLEGFTILEEINLELMMLIKNRERQIFAIFSDTPFFIKMVLVQDPTEVSIPEEKKFRAMAMTTNELVMVAGMVLKRLVDSFSGNSMNRFKKPKTRKRIDRIRVVVLNPAFLINVPMRKEAIKAPSP